MKKKKRLTFKQFKKMLMQDPLFKMEYEALRLEFESLKMVLKKKEYE